ncbi:MAG TPA: type IV pilus modification protein PilV [Steroidobacteraceae bacterium]|jgi:type IV pilus assembly protein PilV|nr:type IV pilus modification protein PilV [Steroidobacteraceae bacterium]
MKPMFRCRRPRGFSLVEVMVALVIIAVGLLGIAKMQALALSSTGSAGTRSLVAIEAASLAASMHTNRDYWGQTPPAVTNVAVSSNGPNQAATVTVDVPTLASAPATCAPCSSNTQLAAYDLQNWALALGQVVPGAATQITCSVASPPLSCTIQITWLENVTSANSSASAAAAANNSGAAVSLNQPQYTLYVEP